MQVTLQEKGKFIEIIIDEDRISFNNIEKLQEIIEQEIEKKHYFININLEKVIYTSSVFFNFILNLYKKMKSLNGQLKLTQISEDVNEALKLVAIDKLIEIECKEV